MKTPTLLNLAVLSLGAVFFLGCPPATAAKYFKPAITLVAEGYSQAADLKFDDYGYPVARYSAYFEIRGIYAGGWVLLPYYIDEPEAQRLFLVLGYRHKGLSVSAGWFNRHPVTGRSGLEDAGIVTIAYEHSVKHGKNYLMPKLSFSYFMPEDSANQGYWTAIELENRLKLLGRMYLVGRAGLAYDSGYFQGEPGWRGQAESSLAFRSRHVVVKLPAIRWSGPLSGAGDHQKRLSYGASLEVRL